jgi:tol-pal system protein YbgF
VGDCRAAGSWFDRLHVERRHGAAAPGDHGCLQAGREPRAPVDRQGRPGRHEPQAGRAVGLRKLRDQIQSLQAELDSTSQRLSALSNELAASREQSTLVQPPPTVPGAPPAAAPPTAGPRGNEPTQLYNAAYEDYLRSNFDLAIQGFREYAKRYPSTDLADNALYWVGESYYSKKQFKEAIDAFTELLNTYKSSDKAAAGLLKKGLAYLEMGDRSQAVINLQYVLYEHPGSKEADLARARLQAMGVKVK